MAVDAGDRSRKRGRKVDRSRAHVKLVGVWAGVRAAAAAQWDAWWGRSFSGRLFSPPPLLRWLQLSLSGLAEIWVNKQSLVGRCEDDGALVAAAPLDLRHNLGVGIGQGSASRLLTASFSS